MANRIYMTFLEETYHGSFKILKKLDLGSVGKKARFGRLNELTHCGSVTPYDVMDLGNAF